MRASCPTRAVKKFFLPILSNSSTLLPYWLHLPRSFSSKAVLESRFFSTCVIDFTSSSTSSDADGPVGIVGGRASLGANMSTDRSSDDWYVSLSCTICLSRHSECLATGPIVIHTPTGF
ncbi:LOW QUALITY PROTEIN: hypothetical protein TorRG33x02_275990 [Trema orientale]|uniref:Uncharacterized protein n=1 Tax=Trema orientale TaxID=63057 RepID=A0A2P5CR33_TREOI|nr:LOW QUALITY PROTEIN: hypothetical protein TorRG33x02_275990 [Trema orientale]